MNIQSAIKQHQLELLFQQGSYGLEKESARIWQNGELATTSHPHIFGNRRFHPYIQTDFAESQLELITPPNKTVHDTMRWLSAIHQIVLRTLPEDEYIFPFSMPPFLPDENQIQVAKLDNPADVAYREHLVDIYGKKKQMVSGIHYNFQISPEFIKQLHKISDKKESLVDFQNTLYLKMTRNFLRYQWILVYLLAATPTVDASYFREGSPLMPGQYVRSLRTSRYGYVNAPEVVVSFDSLQDYVDTLEHWVSIGKLQAEKEFYSNARLRGANKARDLLTTGIQYIEFRLFDLNPFEAYGMSEDDANFIHYFILLMLWLDEEGSQENVQLGKARLAEVALEDPLKETKFKAEGLEMMDKLLTMLESLHAPVFVKNYAKSKREQFNDPSQTLCAKVVKAIEKVGSYEKLGTELAIKYKAQAMEHFYCLEAFADMELSTQTLMFDAIVKGLNVEILDEQDNFLKLQFADHIEYVKNGNMTGKDSYIAPLIMENKVVTKKVLKTAGYNVPDSVEFTDPEVAKASFPLFVDKPMVIKPKSTNFGLGISIFQDGVKDKEDFAKAIDIAFREDKSVMVENYLSGTEYRFFVIGDNTLAVLLRVPANVEGDGKKTIRQLIEIKNDHPLRGDAKRTPLKKITLGDIELLQLKAQGLTPDSIPAKGEIVQLRVNSNISSGGDSIDMTDKMHQSYKEIAVGITKALGAAVCGVDLIIPDYTKPATDSIHSWGVIEANFNPAMMIHIFPHHGKSRRVTRDVLKMLFPEVA